MRLQNKTIIGILEVILGGTFFGLVPIFVRFGQSINTVSLIFFRALFGMIFIYLIIRLCKKKLARFKEERLGLIIFSIVLLLGIGFYFVALKLIDIASAVLLLYGYSIFVVLFSKILLKEKIYSHTWIALVISIIGVILIISPSGFNFGGSAIGYLFGVGSAFWVGLNWVLPKKYFKNYDAYSLTFYQSLWQLPILLIFVFFSLPKFTLTNIGIFVGLGLFCTALAFFFVYSGLRKIRGQYIGILQTSEATVPIILGIILFSEIPSLLTIIGGLSLLLGYIIIGIKGSKN